VLTDDIERYLLLRRTVGFKLADAARQLRAFARFAAARGESHIRATTVIEWAAQAPSPKSRYERLKDVSLLARFLGAEDPEHEVPPPIFKAPTARLPPYIYSPEEIASILDAAGRLKKSYRLRRRVYVTMFGLIAATGMRLSEAIGLRFDDVMPGGVLRIRHTKFGKSRLIPLHPTTAAALQSYLAIRRQVAVVDDHLFISQSNRGLCDRIVHSTFARIRILTRIAPGRRRRPRIHDLRHTFATRALERCATRREAVARHFVALSTYLGHSDIKHTYWYLQATPELMRDIAARAESFVAEGGNE
jgi:integrase